MDRPIALEARSIDLPIEPAFRLGRARIDPEAHEYVIGGKSTRIQPQTLKVLVALHDKSGRVVSRDELIDRCWGGRIVGDDVINRCISQLRLFAAESGGFQIETISRAGYRLIEEAAPAMKPMVSAKPWLIGTAAAAIAMTIGVAAVIEHGRPTNIDSPVEVEPLKASSDDRPALALGEGLGSSIERDLAGSETPVDIVDARSKRPVSLVVRGTSISDHGELRASIQLVSARTGEVLWASNFDRPLNEFDQLQDQLSLQAARILHCAYADGRQRYFDSDVEFARLSLAHCDLLGGHVDDAVRLDSEIVQRAPGFARGWAEYAIDTGFQSYALPPLFHAAGERRAIALARHALALDPHQGLAYAGIGVATEDTASWVDSERLARRGLVEDPKSPEVHNWHSGLLAEIGRLQEGLDEARLSYQLDHFLPGKVDQLVRFDTALGNLDDAQDDLDHARRYFPGNSWFDFDEVMLGVAGGSPDRALKLLTSHQVRMDAPRERYLAAVLRWRIAPTGANKAAAVNALEAAAAEGGPTPEEVEMLARLSDLDRAYRIAARLRRSTDWDIGWFSPDLAAFRSDSRFMPLASRLGLAETWLKSGLWPDFCMGPGKLSACKAEAAAAVANHGR
jgi:DNA-binding winged helix-turn-helix (wHTH) protein